MIESAGTNRAHAVWLYTGRLKAVTSRPIMISELSWLPHRVQPATIQSRKAAFPHITLLELALPRATIKCDPQHMTTLVKLAVYAVIGASWHSGPVVYFLAGYLGKLRATTPRILQ